jgi:hypothetical protein
MFLKRNESGADIPDVVARRSEVEAAKELAGNSAANEIKSDDLITIPELREIQRSGAPILVLDVRAEHSLAESDLRAQGAIRIPPDRAVKRLTELDVPRNTWLVAFCA